MQGPRPLTDSLSVSLAGLTLLALAAGSFTASFVRQLNLPRAVDTAKVVVLPRSDAPPPLPLASLATLEPGPSPKPKPKAPRSPRELETAPATQTPPQLALAPPPLAAPEIGEDAAATGATQTEPAEPPAPPTEEAPAY